MSRWHAVVKPVNCGGLLGPCSQRGEELALHPLTGSVRGQRTAGCTGRRADTRERTCPPWRRIADPAVLPAGRKGRHFRVSGRGPPCRETGKTRQSNLPAQRSLGSGGHTELVWLPPDPGQRHKHTPTWEAAVRCRPSSRRERPKSARRTVPAAVKSTDRGSAKRSTASRPHAGAKCARARRHIPFSGLMSLCSSMGFVPSDVWQWCSAPTSCAAMARICNSGMGLGAGGRKSRRGRQSRLTEICDEEAHPAGRYRAIKSNKSPPAQYSITIKIASAQA